MSEREANQAAKELRARGLYVIISTIPTVYSKLYRVDWVTPSYQQTYANSWVSYQANLLR